MNLMAPEQVGRYATDGSMPRLPTNTWKNCGAARARLLRLLEELSEGSADAHTPRWLRRRALDWACRAEQMRQEALASPAS